MWKTRTYEVIDISLSKDNFVFLKCVSRVVRRPIKYFLLEIINAAKKRTTCLFLFSILFLVSGITAEVYLVMYRVMS